MEFHLDNDVSNKINNSLQTPLATPASKELVGVGTNKEQLRVSVGSGLNLSAGNVLSATGGGGTQLYKHSLQSGNFRIEIVSTSSVALSYDDIYSDYKIMGPVISINGSDNGAALRTCVYTQDNRGYQYTGATFLSTIGICEISSSQIKFAYKSLPANMTDTVVEL